MTWGKINKWSPISLTNTKEKRMLLTNCSIPIANTDKLRLIEHSSGLHIEEAENGCPGCSDDAYESPKEFVSTNS